MIEAVNSVIANAQLSRGAIEQGSSARSSAVGPDVQAVSRLPQAPFISPYISVNLDYDKAVLQIRDSDTGDVLRQFPSESTLEARRRAESVRQNAEILQSTRVNTARDSDRSSRVVSPERSASSSRASLSVPTVQAQQVPDVPSFSSSGSSFVAEAQIASQALSAGAQASQVSRGTISSVTA